MRITNELREIITCMVEQGFIDVIKCDGEEWITLEDMLIAKKLCDKIWK